MINTIIQLLLPLLLFSIHPTHSYLQCQNNAYLETNKNIGSDLGTLRFPSTKFSLETWIRMKDQNIPLGIMEYANKIPGSKTNEETTALSLTIYNNKIQITLNGRNQEWTLPFDGGKYIIPTITKEEWHHVAIVWSNNQGSIRPYINGRMAGAPEDLSTDLIANKGILRLYRSSKTLDAGIGASISEFRIWNEQLTEREIRKIMQSVSPTLTLPNANLFVHYRLLNAYTASLEDLNGVLDESNPNDLAHSLRIKKKESDSTSTCYDSETTKWTIAITAQDITANVGAVITQGMDASLVKGTLHTNLVGVGTTSIIINTKTKLNINFLTDQDLVIGATTIVSGNINTVTKNTDSSTIVDVPKSQYQDTYDQVNLLGSGLVSDPSYNVDGGEEVSIVSFEDDNIITRLSTSDEMILNGQQSSSISGCSENERITSSSGAFALGTREPLMAWIPKSFRGTNFAIPTLRGDTLTITVRSLSSELTASETEGSKSSIAPEDVKFELAPSLDETFKENAISPTVSSTEGTCIKRTPDKINDLYLGNDASASSENNLFDGNVKTKWQTNKNSCDGLLSASGTGYPHCLDIEFSTKTKLSRYTMSNYGGNLQPGSWEIYARDTNNVNVWTLTIASQSITAPEGTTIYYGTFPNRIEGKLKTPLNGATTTIVLTTNAGVTFESGNEIVIGGTTIFGSNFYTAIETNKWNLISKQTVASVQWKSEAYVTKSFWSNSVTSKDVAHKYWRFKFLTVDYPNINYYGPTGLNYIRLTGLSFFECEKNVLKDDSSDRAKGADLITVHVKKKSSASSSSSKFFSFGSSGSMQTDIKWKCTETQPKWYWRAIEYDETKDDVGIWTSAIQIGKTTTLIPSRGEIDTIWHSNSNANEIWCRMAYGEASATLTLTHSYAVSAGTGNSLFPTQIKSLPRNGLYTFALARGQIGQTQWFQSWFNLQVTPSTTSVVVSARSSDSDARAVPAATQRFVGFASRYGKIAPFFDQTNIDIYYYEKSKAKTVVPSYQGGIKTTGSGGGMQTTPNGLQYIKPFAGTTSGYPEYGCPGAAHVYGNKPINAATYQDGSGDSKDATTFFPIEYLSTEFILPSKAKWCSFVTIRPDAPEGKVRLSVYDPLGALIDIIDSNVLFARSTTSTDSIDADEEDYKMRPSCYKYQPPNGIPAGTRFVTDYPTHMVFDEYDTNDETAAFGRGSWGWVQMNTKRLQVTEKDTNPSTKIQSYKIKFQSHDPNDKLGFVRSTGGQVTLGRPTSDLKISFSTDAQITISPSELIFTKDNWNKWQTVNVTAVEDNIVETLVTTSIIRHSIETLDTNYADGRIRIPDVIVDVINVDFDQKVRNLRTKTISGGMIGVEWDVPEAQLAVGNQNTFHYIVEMKDAKTDFVPPTILKSTMKCTESGCETFSIFEIDKVNEILSASVTVKVRKTDYDSDSEKVETITAAAETKTGLNSKVNQILRTDCNPQATTQTGYCGQSDSFSCVSRKSVLKLIKSLQGTEEEKKSVTLTIAAKITDSVSDANGCKDDEGTEVALLTADVEIEIIYKSSNEIYYGTDLVHHESKLKPSTTYRVRAATMSNHGVLSAWTPTVNESPLIIKTSRPTMPSAPVAPRSKTVKTNMHARGSKTGGSLTLIWDGVFDNGGAEIVEYNVLAMEVELSHGAQYDSSEASYRKGTRKHNVSSYVPDAFRTWTSYADMDQRPVQKEDHIVGLLPFTVYNMTVYAVNDVEFCVGNDLVGYPRAHILLDSGLYVSDSVLLSTGRPTRTNAPLEIKTHVPMNPTIESGSGLSIQITHPDQRGGHENIKYDVQYRIPGTKSWNENIDTGVVHDATWFAVNKAYYKIPNEQDYTIPATIRINNLKFNTNYEMRVRSSTSSNAEDPYTLSSTGCECLHDPIRTDCACCNEGATFVQCGAKARTRCHDSAISTISSCNGGGSDVAWILKKKDVAKPLLDWKKKDISSLSSFTFTIWIKIAKDASTYTTEDILNVDLLRFGTVADALSKNTLSYKNGKFILGDDISHTRSILRDQISNHHDVWIHVGWVRNGKQDILYIDGDPIATYEHATTPASIVIADFPPTIDFLTSSTVDSIIVDNIQLWTSNQDINKIRSLTMSGAISKSILATIQSNSNDLYIYQDFNAIADVTDVADTRRVRSDRNLGLWSISKSFKTSMNAERPLQPLTAPKLMTSPTGTFFISPPHSGAIGGGSVSVEWHNGADNGGAPVETYHLYRTKAGKPTDPCTEPVEFVYTNNPSVLVENKISSSVTLDPKIRRGNIVRLKPSSTYGICIASANSIGKSDKSAPLSITTTSATVPGKPTPPSVVSKPVTEFKLVITAQEITATVGTTVTQGTGASLVKGTLKQALTGVGMTSIVIQVAHGVVFSKTIDVSIEGIGASTTILHSTITDSIGSSTLAWDETMITWKEPADDGGSAVLGYWIEYKKKTDSIFTRDSEWTLTISAQDITANVDVTVTQGSVVGTLKTALTGTGTTTVIILTAYDVDFVNNEDVQIGTGASAVTVASSSITTAEETGLIKNIAAPEQLTYVIPKMIANTDYTYRVYAENAEGIGLPSSEYTELSSAICLQSFYGSACESFALCEIQDPVTKNNPMTTAFCNSLSQVLSVSLKDYALVNPNGQTGRGGTGSLFPEQNDGTDTAQPFDTLQAAVDKAKADSTKTMIFLYPGEEKYTNLNGFCGVHVDGGANKLDISILGIKNSIDVWSGTEMTCTRNETVGGIGFDRFLTIGQGNTVALSGITIIGGGIEVQGGTFTGSLFDIHHCGTSKNVDLYGAFYIHDAGNLNLNSVRVHHNYAKNGGAIAAHGGSKIKLCDTTLDENYATLNGGAIWMSSSKLETCVESSSNIVSNTAKHGGGVYCTGSSTEAGTCEIDGTDSMTLVIQENVVKERLEDMLTGAGVSIANVQTATIKNVIVKKNTIHGNGYGSGLSLVGVKSSTLENMKVSNNVVKINRKENDPLISGGGGLSIRSSASTIFKCEFINNTVSSIGGGGGILIDAKSTVSMEDGIVSINQASTGGGIDVEGESVLTLKSNAIISNNIATRNGGGIAVGGKSSMNTNSIKLYMNEARDGMGGGVAVADAETEVKLTTTTFEKNIAAMGGGIGGTDITLVQMDAVTMTNNQAVINQAKNDESGNGGDIWLFASKDSLITTVATLNNVVSTNPTSEKNGASIYSTGKAITITIDKHQVSNSTAKKNGGIYWISQSTMVSDGAIYTKPTSQYDGGVLHASDNAIVTLKQMAVQESKSTLGHGGVICIRSGATVELQKSTVTNTEAKLNGGVVAISGSSSVINVQELITKSCTSRQNGGVFHLENGATLVAKKWNNTISNADDNGGSISGNNHTKITLDSCELLQSIATKDGGHIHITKGTRLSLKNMKMTDGTASKGGSIYASQQSHIDHDGKCLFINNEAKSMEGGGSLYLSFSNFIRAMENTVGKSSLFSNTAPNGGAATVVGEVQMNHLLIKNHKSSMSGTIHILGTEATASSTSSTSLLTLTSIDMNSNLANDYGGHVYVGSRSSLTATDVKFTNGTAIKGGGALFGNDEAKDIHLKKVIIQRNQNTAVIFEGKSIQIDSSSMSDNHADRVATNGGGALLVRNQANATILNTIFQRNVATNREGGDIVCAGGSFCILKNSAFYGTVVKPGSDPLEGILGTLLPSKGGAVAILSGSTTHILDTTFNNTKAKVGGGAIFVGFSSLVTKGVIIDSGRSNKGAGILLESAVQASLIETTFIQCESVYDGGALHATTSVVKGKDLKFLNNRAGIFGGAVLISEDASLELSDSIMTGNIAWLGGALAMDRDSFASISTTTFSHNQARMGGAFYVSVNPSPVIFKHSIFQHNTARFGSAMYVEFSHAEIQHTTVSDNTATLFAAIRVTGVGSFSASHSTLERNTATKGGVLYVDDNTNITLMDTELNYNVAEEDGGAIYGGGASMIRVQGCTLKENVALKGEGGAIARTRGASLTVDGSKTNPSTTFKSNLALKVGGAMSLNSLLCRSKESCSSTTDGVNTMTSAYESCRSGDALENTETAAANSKVAALPLVRCTDIKNVKFESNKAAAGAGIYWYRQWHFTTEQHSQYLPCPSIGECIFLNNVASPCKSCNSKTDLGCYNCESNIQTDTQNILMGWSPSINQTIQSGTPIENKEWITSPEDTDIYLVAVDYYSQLSRLDDTSNCHLERICKSTQGKEHDNCFDPKAGMCKIQDVTVDPLAKNKLLMTGIDAVSERGIIRFYDLIIKADPNPLLPYHVQYICSTNSVAASTTTSLTTGNEDNSVTTAVPCNVQTEEEESVAKAKEGERRQLININQETRPIVYLPSTFVVDHCNPGSQLTGEQVCERCSAGKYSPNGQKCSNCPTGGTCDVMIQLTEKTSVQMGVAIPNVKNGYWNETAPPNWIQNECNTTKTVYGSNSKSPHDITTEWGTNEDCQPGDCVDDIKWSVDRLHRCRRSIHFYKCDTEGK